MNTYTEDTGTFERFDLSLRIQHILLIISFTVLAVTGLPQLFVRAGWSQGIMSLFGDLDGVRQTHHLSATMLAFLFVFHLFNVLFDLLVGNKARIVPKLQDVKDAVQSFGYLLGKSAEKPKYDKFDFRQKLEYWALIWGTFLMGFTGLILMFPAVFSRFLPGDVIYAAKAAHGLEALLAVGSIVIWHMYNTHIIETGLLDTTIFTGKISHERLMEEHPLEYQRLVEQESQTAKTNEEIVEVSDDAEE